MSVTVIGDAFIDILVPASVIKPGETYHRRIRVACGGSANIATQIAKLGEKVKFMGRVSNDPLGLCISLVYEDGKRSMVASRGANDHWPKQEVDTYLG